MSLPLILDIAIGLIFIYLILSLLASEIQELIATLLQWRAKHFPIAIS
jgi:flagellar biosynthesis protein FliR